MRWYCNSEGVRSSRDSCHFVCTVVKDVECMFQLGGNSIDDSKTEAIKHEVWGASLTDFLSLECLISWSITEQWKTKSTTLNVYCFSDCLRLLSYFLWMFSPCFYYPTSRIQSVSSPHTLYSQDRLFPTSTLTTIKSLMNMNE